MRERVLVASLVLLLVACSSAPSEPESTGAATEATENPRATGPERQTGELGEPASDAPPATAERPHQAHGSVPTTEEPPAAEAVSPARAPSDERTIRRGLEPKVWSGQASVEEIRMLRAICSHMGDLPCRDRATAALEKKRSSL